MLVFDGYKVKGNPGTTTDYHHIHVVYTRQDETGDLYIERLLEQIGKNYAVRVATSDGLIQLSALRAGCCSCPPRSCGGRWNGWAARSTRRWRNSTAGGIYPPPPKRAKAPRWGRGPWPLAGGPFWTSAGSHLRGGFRPTPGGSPTFSGANCQVKCNTSAGEANRRHFLGL